MKLEKPMTSLENPTIQYKKKEIHPTFITMTSKNFLDSQNPMGTEHGYYDPSLVTETQDPTALEMAAYGNQSMSKEDFGIITTTQEGILNSLNIMSEEIGKHTSIILNKMDQLIQERKKKVEEKKQFKCYTCGEPGHMSPRCPHKENYNKENTPKEEYPKKEGNKSTACFICKEEGHWMRECPQKEEYYRNKNKKAEEIEEGEITDNYSKYMFQHLDGNSNKENIKPGAVKGIKDNGTNRRRKKQEERKNQEKEDWDEELKKEQKIPGKMRRIKGQNVFVEETDWDNN